MPAQTTIPDDLAPAPQVARAADPVAVVDSKTRTTAGNSTATRSAYGDPAFVETGGRLIAAAMLMGLALFSSGAAGLINQVVWQRSLKVFLGGSESICSMIVVLVFMAGLGCGSVWMGGRTRKLRNPLKAFGQIEIALALVNVCICGILAADFSRSVFELQRIALSLGTPLLVLYGLGSIVVLLVPCLLMGATMPLAAEACQRNLGLRDSRMLGLLFFINTLGSVAGTAISSGYMIAHLGQTLSLVLAAGMNLFAGICLLALIRRYWPTASIEGDNAVTRALKRRSLLRPSLNEKLALGLGVCSLGYEMFLFRLIPLRHQPLPFTFAAVLTGFLLFWSIGAALSSSKQPLSLSTALRLCGLTAVASIPMFVFDRPTPITNTGSLVWFVIVKTPYFLPCLFFGYLFGLVVRRAAKSWGSDIGRVYGWNTCGSCLGILGMTFVGYEIPFFMMVLVIALLLFTMDELLDAPPLVSRRFLSLPRWAYPFSASGLAIVAPFVVDLSGVIPNQKLYCGRDGVVILDEQGNMFWDGLWHSKLSNNNDHIGSNNWYLAVCPALCHPTGEIEDVCVIGVATGITASTLAQLETVKQVDAYDISRVLRQIFRDYPAGTLHLSTNEKVQLIWQDARSGLELNPKKYDLIQAQPLYLKQSGSSLLNSVEFLKLVGRRLKLGGVFCLYSNGTADQAFAIRETADRVFAHRESFFDGYLVILSNDPIQVSEAAVDRKLGREDPFWKQIRSCSDTGCGTRVMRLLDRPRLARGDGRLVITDDHPIVEYPNYLSRRLRDAGYSVARPKPLPSHLSDE